jgi:ABC-type glycerol-3-phosphate transport system substrate-binding protein
MLSRRTLSLRALQIAALGAGTAVAGRKSVAAQGQSSVHITQLMNDFQGWIDDVKEIYGRFPGQAIDLDVISTPFADLDRTIRSTPNDPAPPDLLLVDSSNIPTYATLGLLRPLDDVFSAEDQADFLPAPLANSTWDGHFWGPALTESSQGLYYNKEILDRYGIVPPSTLADAWTWSQARDVFIEVQAKEREARGDDRFWALTPAYAYSGIRSGAIYDYGSVVRSNGETGSPTFMVVSEDGMTASGYVNTPEAVEAYEFLQKLWNDDALATRSESQDIFTTGQAAFWFASMYHHTIIDTDAPDLAWGVTPLPYFKTPVVHTGSFHVVASGLGENQDLAAQLVQFLGMPANLEQTNKTAGQIPPRFSGLPNAPEINEAPLKIFTDTATTWGHSRPRSAGASELNTIWSAMLADILEGAPAQDAADTAAEELDRQLARYKDIAS